MKPISIKVIRCLICLQLFAVASFAQESFDKVTFTAPIGWERTTEKDAIQFAKQNGNKVAMLTLFRSLPTSKDPEGAFDASWDALVKGTLTKVDAPQMQPAVEKNGWTIESGAAIGEKDGDRMVATLLSATGGGKVVNLLILYNGESFQPEIERFVSSIELAKLRGTPAVNRPPTNKSSGGTVQNASPAPNSLDARYSCLKMVYRSGATVFDPAGLGFSISGNSYSVVGGTGGKVARSGDDIIFSGGRLNGFRGEMRSYSNKTYILFRVDFTQVRRGESGRMGDLQCYRQ